jgi:excisionase family DNA binding protein
VNLDDPDLLKIADAARYLGVTRRTIYRRIWKGDLPASKVGGLYFIRRQDLEALLIRGRTKPAQTEAETSPTLKCQTCFRDLESDEQIAELCATEGCENLICDRCWAEDLRHCIRHIPNKIHKLKQAENAFQQGQLDVYLTSRRARLQEINIIQRIQGRVEQIDTFIHPQTEEVTTVSDFKEYCNQGDERATLMQLMGKMILDKNTSSQMPLNAWVCWDLPKEKRQQGLPLRIQAQVISRLAKMLRDGFDSLPLDEDDLVQRLLKLGEIAQTDQVVNLVVLAASTGWDAEARMVIQGKSPGKAFVHQNLLVYLFDMQTRELIYNLNDPRLQGYTDLFAPLLPEEEINEAINLIEKQFITHDSLSLAQAGQSLPFAESAIEKAFQRLAETGEYALTTVPEIGTALVRI